MLAAVKETVLSLATKTPGALYPPVSVLLPTKVIFAVEPFVMETAATLFVPETSIFTSARVMFAETPLATTILSVVAV